MLASRGEEHCPAVRVFRIATGEDAAAAIKKTQRVHGSMYGGRLLDRRARDHRGDDRDRTAPLLTAADSIGIHSTGAASRSPVARQTFHRGVALRQYE